MGRKTTTVNEGLYRAWVASIAQRTQDDFDDLIVFTGYTGNGKSTAAWWFGHCVDESFSSHRMAFTEKIFLNQLQRAPPGGFVLHDEAVDGQYSRESNTYENRDINRTLDVCRARRVLMGMCIPNLRWLDARTRDERARWIVDVPRRGLAVVWRRRETEGRVNPSATADGSVLQARESRWRPCFRYRFPTASGADWEAYSRVKAAHVRSYRPTRGPKSRARGRASSGEDKE